MSRRQPPWGPAPPIRPRPVFDGERVRAERLARGLTAEKLAREINVSLRTVQRWQDGETEPRLTQLFALARVFGISPKDLYREPEPDDEPAAA